MRYSRSPPIPALNHLDVVAYARREPVARLFERLIREPQVLRHRH
jgi:hypothetical protein